MTDDPRRHLETVWARSIPLSTAMGIRVLHYAPGELTVTAALEPNVNVHGTGFAGSQYAVAALAGWGLIYLELRARALDAAIVIARGEIDYARPVEGDFRARAELGDGAGALEALPTRGRTRLTLSAPLTVDGVEKARFRGEYALRMNSGRQPAQ